jgi:hypothetical protein
MAAPARSRSVPGGRSAGSARRCPTPHCTRGRDGTIAGRQCGAEEGTLAHNLALPASIKPDPPPTKIDNRRLRLPNDAEIKHVMAFEKVWRRVVAIVRRAARRPAQVVSRRLSAIATVSPS